MNRTFVCSVLQQSQVAWNRWDRHRGKCLREAAPSPDTFSVVPIQLTNESEAGLSLPDNIN